MRYGRKIGKDAEDDCVPLDRTKAAMILEVFKTKGENGPVRKLDGKGKVANLPDPWQNQRSKAAILAKKYQEESQRLRNIYNASQKRELTEPEVASVFAFMGWEYAHSEGTGDPYESPFVEDDLAGDGGGDRGEMETPGGCPEPEYDGEGSDDGGAGEGVASGMAGPEEDDGDSCL